MKQTTFTKWLGLFVLSLALAIIIIDTTLLNVSLGTIIRELHTDIQSLQWVITLYALVLAALTITGGRLGDMFGRKKMFMLGALIFALGSLMASYSTSVSMLIWGEAIVEGIGAAMMMPATASLLVANFQGRERAIAFGVWGGVAAAASAVGPILGGYLTSHYSWRWGFRINVVVAILLLIGSVVIKEYKQAGKKITLDWIGVILSGVGLLAIVFGIIESSTYGWLQAKQVFTVGAVTLNFGNVSIVPISIVLGICLLIGFVFWERALERDGETPLVSLSFFRNSQFTSGITVTAIVALSQIGMIFALPVYLQAVLGKDAYNTGIALLPLSITLLIVSPLAAAVSHKIKPKHLIQVGLVLNAIALTMMTLSLSTTGVTNQLVWSLMIYGAGLGLVMSQINNLTLSAVPVTEAGVASGVNSTMRQVGASFGSAIVGAVLLATLSTNLANGVQASSVIPDAIKPQLSQALSTQTSNVEFGENTALASQLPPQLVDTIKAIAHQATTDAASSALSYTAIFAGIAILISIKLPSVKNLERAGKPSQAK